jgi:alkanesulfonate monooxygenase SsuD/methylene tetrahydromethanopterin reductase-like flavin-dependent oxidoreductase (luciferase family)
MIARRDGGPMKAGVLQFFSWPERRVPLETVYQRALQRIEIMDDAGYDAVWLAEHHFSAYSVCPSVHLMAMHVAGRTKNLRIGTGVTLAAFYNPLRIAEEVALLDVLSEGRVNWGAGRGFDQREFRAFDVPVEESSERFRENVEVVLAAWNSERLTFHGRYNHFDDVEVLPKPRQKPHPPVWLAATSPDSVRAAAAKGYSILMDPHAPHAEIGRKRALYGRTLAEHGFSEAGRTIPVARLLAVAPTAAEAEAVAREGAKWTLASYITRTHGDGANPVDRYVNETIIHGTPESVLDQVCRLREEIGLEYLLCAPLSHQSFLLFTEKVLPRLP